MARKAAKQKQKLPEPPKPKYVMAAPNDDIAAFAWDMSRLRYPSKDSKPNDVWPGPPLFEIPESPALRDVYGFDITFINAKYVQFLFDQNAAIRAGAEKVRAANYKQAAIEEFKTVVEKVFRTVVVPEMLKHFNTVSLKVAEFYAARLAHIDKFGVDE
jgi:hypothetical protein